MTKDELYEMFIKTQDEYLKMRDFKSNGCCVSMTFHEILLFDLKMERLKQKLLDLQEQMLKSYKSKKEVKV
ncbi:hypothetical protein [Thermosipho sp. (in: thermotogales)]|jgi:hypothetical protein|uniref:hypothetical protein n=1 Tax=Thermosipho sp. (in: thermotogales) TaxID=1968895 RepID=UPI00257DCD8B|nr:hypothetical protein [Thermosipho sp. (in: thermotogales)]MBZ4649207.1 hypothetical protein [Thermosipho sp. (in: thermotogales)]